MVKRCILFSKQISILGYRSYTLHIFLPLAVHRRPTSRRTIHSLLKRTEMKIQGFWLSSRIANLIPRGSNMNLRNPQLPPVRKRERHKYEIQLPLQRMGLIAPNAHITRPTKTNSADSSVRIPASKATPTNVFKSDIQLPQTCIFRKRDFSSSSRSSNPFKPFRKAFLTSCPTSGTPITQRRASTKTSYRE